MKFINSGANAGGNPLKQVRFQSVFNRFPSTLAADFQSAAGLSAPERHSVVIAATLAASAIGNRLYDDPKHTYAGSRAADDGRLWVLVATNSFGNTVSRQRCTSPARFTPQLRKN